MNRALEKQKENDQLKLKCEEVETSLINEQHINQKLKANQDVFKETTLTKCSQEMYLSLIHI